MKKKKALKIVLLVLFLPLPALLHFFVFPEETRCILVPLSGMEKTGNIYHCKNSGSQQISKIQAVRLRAEQRNKSFWKEQTILDYKIIYCDTKADFKRYAPAGVPAATYMKLGAYIVLQSESIDEDILAHEISHTILYRQIGWYKRTFTIPTWFDEGLAMQVDLRPIYSADTLMANTAARKMITDVKTFSTASTFFSGPIDDIILRYAAARFSVGNWLKNHTLSGFITSIKAGKGFKNAYMR